MGFPNKKLKRRRHSRNMKLFAMVSLGGVRIRREMAVTRRRPEGGLSTGAYCVIPLYSACAADGSALSTWRNSPMGAITDAAEHLGVL